MACATRPSRGLRLLPTLGPAILSLALAADPEAPGAPPAQPAPSLAQRLLKSLEGDRDEMKRWTYVESAVLEKRASDGQVRSRTNEVYEIFFQDGRRMKRAVSLDLANDSDSFATIRREESRFLPASGARGAAPADATAAKESPFEVEKLLRCFRLGEPARDEGARPVLKVAFTPVDGCLDDGSRAGRLLQNLGGSISVDEQDGDIVKIEGALQHPVTFGFGLLGRIDEFTLEVDRQTLAKGLYAMTHVNYRARGTAFIFRRFDVTSIRDRSAFARQPDTRATSQEGPGTVARPDAEGTPTPVPR